MDRAAYPCHLRLSCCSETGARRLPQSTTLDLFAGIPVADYAVALRWYERLLGYTPTFLPNDAEAVWELAEHRYVYIVRQPEHAGHGRHTLFVADLDALIAQLAERGLDPMKRETCANGVRRITYRDPDGNRIGFGGAPLYSASGQACVIRRPERFFYAGSAATASISSRNSSRARRLTCTAVLAGGRSVFTY
jgi:hypothetical protein